MSTYFAKANQKERVEKKWVVVDARDQIVGRLATRLARLLQGKTDPGYTPHVDTGIGVIVINAAHVRVTGNKAKDKIYKNFSGFPSGQRERTYERVMREDPTFVLKSAVKGMLPKSRMGRKALTHFLVYAGNEHPHSAQMPKVYETKEGKK